MRLYRDESIQVGVRVCGKIGSPVRRSRRKEFREKEEKIMKRPNLKRSVAFGKIVAENFPELKERHVLEQRNKVARITCHTSGPVTEWGGLGQCWPSDGEADQ